MLEHPEPITIGQNLPASLSRMRGYMLYLIAFTKVLQKTGMGMNDESWQGQNNDHNCSHYKTSGAGHFTLYTHYLYFSQQLNQI